MGAEPLHAGDLVGRDDELSGLLGLLGRRTRLVTLTGPPGVGKTRLAVEAAAQSVDRFEDGVAFVDLSSAQQFGAAIAATARAVGMRSSAGEQSVLALHEWLGSRRILLVLDNAEQVVGLAGWVADLLAACPHLRLLVTSRENLRLTMEHELSVPPLAMPRGDDIGRLDRLSANPSVLLFAAAAREVQPDFDVTADNASDVAEICVRLDGLPLALRLAAARAKLFTPAEMAARLRDRRAVLEATARDVPARHRTLRAAISWSHDVLDDRERMVFRRLSIFVGPCTIEAAEHVCGLTGDEIVGPLASLVDKSLLQRTDDDGPTRLTMLQSLKDFASEQLDLHGERAETAARHGGFCVAAASEAESIIGTPDEGRRGHALAHQEGDFLAALEWAKVADLDAALGIATTLGWYSYLRGDVGAGRDILDGTLARVADAATVPSTASVAAAQLCGGVLAWANGDLGVADDLLGASLASSAASGDRRHEAMALAFTGHVARERGRHDAARAAHGAAGRIYDELGNRRGSAWARFDLGRVAWQAGELDEAADLLRQAVALLRDIDYEWAGAWATWALGAVALARGDVDDAAGLTGRALEMFEASPDRRGVAGCVETLARVAEARGRPQEALRLIGGATALRARLAAPLGDFERVTVDAMTSRIRGAIGDYRADVELETGHAWPIAGLLSAARATAGGLDPVPRDDTSALAVLTARERDVAKLVAAGCTNQQIGRRLGIASRTAESHLANIMGKLGARSRSEVAVWAVTNGLLTGSRTGPEQART